MNSANFLQLADTLDTVPDDKFEMRAFAINRDGESLWDIEDYHCGTAGCAVGWAPKAGFPILDTDSDWTAYSTRIFGLAWDDYRWDWCFAGQWSGHDNTPKGAAARIRHIVNHGLPENWRAQMFNDAPKRYLESASS
jgi:hypothetical protein